MFGNLEIDIRVAVQVQSTGRNDDHFCIEISTIVRRDAFTTAGPSFSTYSEEKTVTCKRWLESSKIEVTDSP
jgi:hypothetical protein